MTAAAATTTQVRTAARVLVDQLRIQGVERAACVPGESYLSVLDALIDSDIDLLTCRAEGGAAMMAEAYGKLTGRPGICFVTRGPGATNASPGVHIASQDSTPMILFVGQVDRGMRGREAFQELDYPAVFGTMAKWVVEIDRADRIPEIIARAFRVALQGRPGPVVISLPEDMLDDLVTVQDAPPVRPVSAAVTPSDLRALEGLLASAERPLVIVGGSRWSEETCGELVAFAERFDLPVATSFRRAHLFPATHPNYVGDLSIGANPRLVSYVEQSDLVILIGGRMSEIPSASYTLLKAPVPDQTLVHVHPDSEELGRVYQPTLAINTPPKGFLQSVAGLNAPTAPAWKEARAALRAHYIDWSETPADLPGDFQYGQVMRWLRERAPADTIVCNGAGNFAAWIHRHYRFRQFATQLAPTSGSMGYGVPAGVMAKRQYPDRLVLTLAGDGDFLMNGQEFATAVQYGIPLIVAVIDNGMYGTIRMHQEKTFPARIAATTLNSPDFAAYARAFGGHGETVRTTDEFAPAFERAVASGLPAIIHCHLDPEALTPGATLSQIRADAEARVRQE